MVAALRLVSWNIENLARWLEDATSMVEQHVRLGAPDVLCLQEVRIRPQDVALVERMRQDAPVNAPDPGTFYTPGAQGYTDYPALTAQE